MMTDKPVSERATVSELRRAAHREHGIVHLKENDPACSVCALADRLEEAERHVKAAEALAEMNSRNLDGWFERAEKAEREVEAKERQRARLDEALSVVTAHRYRLECEVASYEGMDRAVTHYQEEVRRLERELDETRKQHSHYVDGVCCFG